MGLQLIHEHGEFAGCYQPIGHQRRTVKLGEANEESVVILAAVDVGRADSPEAHLLQPGGAQHSG